MKFSYVCTAAALALTAVLAACGGKAQFTVQGSAVNVNSTGLVLANGGDTVSVPVAATTFAFPKQIDYGTDYNIVVQKNPDNMQCSVAGGQGSAGHTVTIQALVTCVQNSYILSGQITGLTPDPVTKAARTVTLLNGSTGGAIAISSDATTNGTGDFAFGIAVYTGQAYGVTVQDPKNNLICTVTNGTGVMPNSPVSNVLVNCTQAPATSG
ncbi:hypothetical protein SAMN05192549_10679 [Duganella sacchari]|uniref:Lipoprotein n=1 Tax=Duganella sacchari TaxID=551987 RepID=A0A1M7Q1P6_9BURK|nr:hypothetical protein [Duganella sacchari]SHN24085.1 hypothetical protein SAMN05192549_10679 [Duganella sacchari]